MRIGPLLLVLLLAFCRNKGQQPFPGERCEELLGGCRCLDYGGVTGIVCRNVSDFGHFSRILSGGELFQEGETFEITVEEIRVLPESCLRGLIVFRIFLECPELREVEDGAFEGVRRLRRFHVRMSSIQGVPDFRSLKNSLRNVNLENSLLATLEGDGLQGLHLLESLSFVNNSISRIESDVFQGTSNVIIFDISYNELTFLPAGLFDNWKRLKKAVLSHNRLLHVNGLFSFRNTKLQFIYLDSNNLTDLDSLLPHNMSQIETLQLSHNPFGRVTRDSFNGKVDCLRFLYLDHCLIREFDVSHYQALSNLATLDLSHNLLERLPHQTINFGKNVELDFIGNKIVEFSAELPFSVRRMYMDDNHLTTLGKILQFSQMMEVSIADNRIQELVSEEFHGVHGVQVLDLQGNFIAGVERMTFSSIRKDLISLDLSRNRLRTLNGSVRYISLLTSLNLTDNQIEWFEEGEFSGLNELAELYLQHNRFTELSGQVQTLPQLQYLVIRHNRIQTLRREQIPDTLKYLHLAGNPFRCDCQLFPFLQYLNSSSTPGTDVPLCTETSTSLAGCPKPCSCACANVSNDHFLSVDCSSRDMKELPSLFLQNSTSEPQKFPSLFLSLTRAGNNLLPFFIVDQIGAIDLSNNSIQSIEGSNLPQSMRQLHLADNLLKDPLPNSILVSSRLTAVTLSGNPWTCSCDALAYKKWILSKSDIVLDINETSCGPDEQGSPDLSGRLIWTLNDLDLCPTDIGFYISLAFGVLSFFLMMAALKITWTRYGEHLRVMLYSRGVTWVKEKDIDRDKLFDAFFSFSHKDEHFVIPKIIKVIEAKEPNVRLCLHYKHFTAGEFIHDNILRAVDNSKRTVLILSKNFLESEWCMMEFRVAHVQALKDRVNRILVIKMGELPKDMDPSIQLYLDSTTYLTWGEKYFWSKLFYVLPNSGIPQTSLTEETVGTV